MKNTQANTSSDLDTQEASGRANSKFLLAAVLGTLFGMLVTLIGQYFTGIFKQPRLVSKAVLFGGWQEFDTEETRGLFIAAENLRAGIAERRLDNGDRKQILHAGYRNFPQAGRVILALPSMVCWLYRRRSNHP